MKIGIIASHAWPVPYKTHTGDYVYALLAQTLDEMGHQITFYAPKGSYCPPHGRTLEMPCAYGKYPPAAQDCEAICYHSNYADLVREDIIHDFSTTKFIAEQFPKKSISTLFSSNWKHPENKKNITVCSKAHREKGLLGQTDYHGTVNEAMGGPAQLPLKEAHVVYLGIDTDFYSPTYRKENFFLWMGRWHPIRGYKEAIQIAKNTGVKLVLAGEHPDNEEFASQRECAMEAEKLAQGCPNIEIVWLPADPAHHLIKRQLLQAAQAFLYTVQFHEPFGLSQVEALACGTPVIAPNMGSCPEIIKHNKTGLIVSSQATWEEALDRVNLINVRYCRKDAVNRFDRNVMAKNFLEEYRKVLDLDHKEFLRMRGAW